MTMSPFMSLSHMVVNLLKFKCYRKSVWFMIKVWDLKS